jgi:glycosyltransferase involved in cell wall biosynthesis
LELFRRKQPYTKKDSSAGPAIVITAQFRLGKRLREGVRIVNALRAHFPSVKLHIIGEQDVLTKDSLTGLPLDACVFHGPLASDVLPDFYSRMDVGISPSLFDACPNSVIEMLACGLPVITTSASGASELVPSWDSVVTEGIKLDFMEIHNPLKIPPVNVDSWCDRIFQILSKKFEYSEQALDHARENFDIRVIAERYKNLILKSYYEKFK